MIWTPVTNSFEDVGHLYMIYARIRVSFYLVCFRNDFDLMSKIVTTFGEHKDSQSPGKRVSMVKQPGADGLLLKKYDWYVGVCSSFETSQFGLFFLHCSGENLGTYVQCTTVRYSTKCPWDGRMVMPSPWPSPQGIHHQDVTYMRYSWFWSCEKMQLS